MSKVKLNPFQRLTPTQKANVARGVKRDIAISRFNDPQDDSSSSDGAETSLASAIGNVLSQKKVQ